MYLNEKKHESIPWDQQSIIPKKAYKVTKEISKEQIQEVQLEIVYLKSVSLQKLNRQIHISYLRVIFVVKFLQFLNMIKQKGWKLT